EGKGCGGTFPTIWTSRDRVAEERGSPWCGRCFARRVETLTMQSTPIRKAAAQPGVGAGLRRKHIPSSFSIPPYILPKLSGITGPGRCPQSFGCVPQQQRDRQTEDQHHQTQEAQAPLEPGRDALHLGEAAQNRAGLLLKGRPAQAALPVIV